MIFIFPSVKHCALSGNLASTGQHGCFLFSFFFVSFFNYDYENQKSSILRGITLKKLLTNFMLQLDTWICISKLQMIYQNMLPLFVHLTVCEMNADTHWYFKRLHDFVGASSVGKPNKMNNIETEKTPKSTLTQEKNLSHANPFNHTKSIQFHASPF